MLFREIFKTVGHFLFIFALVLLIPLGVAFYYQSTASFEEHPQMHVTMDFLYAFASCLILASALTWLGRGAKWQLYRREGIAVVVLIWLITPAIAAIPLLTSKTLTNPFQAYFEMVSGFTTTGSTMLQAKAYNAQTGEEVPITKTIDDSVPIHYSYYGTVAPVRDPQTGKVIKEGVEAVSKAILFWRSFTQWIGGVGIVVLFVAVLPALGLGGKVLFQSEISGPVKEGITPRIKDTAMQLWRIYLGLTLIQIIALELAKPDLPFFEAIVIAFSTLSTGGFSTMNTSIAGYASAPLEWVVIFFMFLGSVNFSLYYFLLRGKFFKFFDPEFLLYLVILPLFAFLVIHSIAETPYLALTGKMEGVFTWSEAFRTGLFQLVSAQTSTGFATVDFDIWPYPAQMIMLISMFIGGMSGSTSGGMKVIRQYTLFKIAQNKVESIFRPDHIKILKIGSWEVDYPSAITVLCFFLIVVATGTVGTLCYVYDGIDLETALGLTACMLNNVGLAFRMAGPEYSCAFLSDFGTVVACLEMLFGRLEYYAMLAVLVPAFWRQDS